MRKEHFYKIAIIVLLLLNLGTLGYLFMGNKRPMHGPPPGHEGPAGLIIERLQLDEEQQQKFEEQRFEHQSKIRAVRKESGELHDALFSLLKNEAIDSIKKDSLQNAIRLVEIKKDEITFEHFQQLKSILKPEQLPLFDGLIEEIGRRLTDNAPGGGRRDGPPPPHRR